MQDNRDSDATLLDPYFLLEVSQTASDEEIQASFHRKMQTCSNQKELMQAYSSIRNQNARNHHRWNTIASFILDPNQEEIEKVDLDLEGLVRELAFLSDWEVGDMENV